MDCPKYCDRKSHKCSLKIYCRRESQSVVGEFSRTESLYGFPVHLFKELMVSSRIYIRYLKYTVYASIAYIIALSNKNKVETRFMYNEITIEMYLCLN